LENSGFSEPLLLSAALGWAVPGRTHDLAARGTRVGRYVAIHPLRPVGEAARRLRGRRVPADTPSAAGDLPRDRPTGRLRLAAAGVRYARPAHEPAAVVRHNLGHNTGERSLFVRRSGPAGALAEGSARNSWLHN